MQFSINSSILAETLNIANKAISSSSPVPSLLGIYIEALDNSLRITTSNDKISIKTIVKSEAGLEIIDNGSLLISANYLNEIVRKIDGKQIKFETIDGTLTCISGDKAEFKINGLDPRDYPAIDFEAHSNFEKVSLKTLINLTKATSFATSDKETRPALCGVNLKYSDEVLMATGTDSYRLAQVKVSFRSPIPFNITVPTKALSDLSTVFDENDDVKMAIENNRMLFKDEKTTMVVRLIEDAYPETKQLIPASFSQNLKIDRNLLRFAVDRATLINAEGKNVVRLEITNERVRVTSLSRQIGSSEESVPCVSYEGDPLTISCSGKYLYDALSALQSENVILYFRGELKPIIIKNEEDESIVQLISPVRSYE